MTPKNTTRRSRARRLASAAAVVAVLDGSPVLAQPAQPSDVWAHYVELSGKGTFSFKMDGQTYTKNVGALRWDVPADRLSAGGLDRNFTAFCAEPLVGVTAGNTYRFHVQNPEDPEAYGLPNTDAGREQARVRAAYIRELFGRHYLTSLNFENPDNARAFQVALWELAYEKQLPQADGENTKNAFSLGTGTFQSDYPNAAAAPAFVATAEGYLKSLTGDDTVFSQNPGLAGRVLVRMNGLPNLAGVVAQDQYALATPLAMPAGAGIAPVGGLTGGAFGGAPVGGFGGGFGGPVGGYGGGFAGGIGGFGNNGSSSPPPGSTINSPPTSPPQSNVPPPPFSPPPINSPPPPPGGQSPPPPGSPPPPDSPPPPPDVPPPNPVPAPPGLLLGGIAALALAGRRALFRSKK